DLDTTAAVVTENLRPSFLSQENGLLGGAEVDLELPRLHLTWSLKGRQDGFCCPRLWIRNDGKIVLVRQQDARHEAEIRTREVYRRKVIRRHEQYPAKQQNCLLSSFRNREAYCRLGKDRSHSSKRPYPQSGRYGRGK